MDNERKWIRQIKRNFNHSAANELISKYYKEMYAFVYKQTLNYELSMDITQEIFINVLRSLPNYDEKKSSFRTWLYKVASNRLIDYFRSKNYKYSQMIEPIENYEIEDGKDISFSLEYTEDIMKITSIVNQLDISSQKIIRLKLFGEYTLQEISEMESLPLSTVKSRFYAAMKHIKLAMKEEDM